MDISSRLLVAMTKSWGAVAAILALALTILPFFVVPDKSTIPTRWVLVIGVPLAFFLVAVIRALSDAVYDHRWSSPKVLIAFRSPSHYEDSAVTLLVEPTALLSLDSVVAVCRLSDSVEHMLALGMVLNIQDDGNVQIALKDSEQNRDEVAGLLGGGSDKLGKLE